MDSRGSQLTMGHRKGCFVKYSQLHLHFLGMFWPEMISGALLATNGECWPIANQAGGCQAWHGPDTHNILLRNYLLMNTFLRIVISSFLHSQVITGEIFSIKSTYFLLPAQAIGNKNKNLQNVFIITASLKQVYIHFGSIYFKGCTSGLWVFFANKKNKKIQFHRNKILICKKINTLNRKTQVIFYFYRFLDDYCDYYL